MANRKDSNGRVLQKGESQRKNGTYMYRYTGLDNTKRTIYAPTLKKLREKEKEVNKGLCNGVDLFSSSPTLIQLVESYLGLKTMCAPSTKLTYKALAKKMSKDVFCQNKIQNITKSAAQQWIIKLQTIDNVKYATIEVMLAIIKPAVNLALDDGLINRNPFDFKLYTLLKKDRKVKQILPLEEEKRFLEFIKSHGRYKYNYGWVATMLETGLRVGELAGLTLADLDFDNGLINVNKQLQMINGVYHIAPPKTKNGFRKIPMTQKFKEVISYELENRNIKMHYIIDGIAGFVFHGRNGTLRNKGVCIANLHRMIRDYNSEYNTNLPDLTPHDLRHTFCTKLVRSNMNLKAIQYIMGHSSVKISLDIYTHLTEQEAVEEFRKIDIAI